ncbi:MAG: uroporphyrinogen decarboxylase [Alphaproteobacteria bacterium]|nr:uroporphyrinogen decarboxylase [Alphaproteobacteria bacterium]MBP7758725.1 uroporphyrinogen decarboxylase [Alphaproteobacteria bacterium]MBP7761753.1 uroporphyrinogen decarboxylase [Alphaproteobacteria bacterium]MBP7903696.1 uroporphyrinogen decarboxylase [Alphaproteobacteria bacterium]
MRGIKKNMLEALRKHKPDHVPVWLMRQAGRYLPEYREVRARAGSFLDLVYDPDLAAEVTLQPIRRFGMDGAILFSDILVIPQALGQKLEFVEGEGPKLEPLRSGSDIAKLNFSVFDQTLSPVYETVKKVCSGLEAEGFTGTTMIGFAGAPWTVACYMVEGGSSRDFLEIKKLAYQHPELLEKLMDLLVEGTAAYLIRQVKAGAEVLQIFDSWAGIVDAQQFKKWVSVPTRKIVDLVREAYPQVPIIGFPRGAGVNYISYLQDTGVNALSLDPQIETKWAVRVLQSSVPVQGNLDPVCLMAGGDALILAVEKIVHDFAGGPFVFNLGHGIHKDTPVENVELLVNTLREMKG